MLGKFFIKTGKILTFLEEWTLFVSVFAALSALFVHVILRAFNHSLSWSEEFVRLVIIYSTFVGCSIAVRKRSMIKIDAIVQILPQFKSILTFFSNSMVIVFSFMLIYYGIKMSLLQLATGQKTIIMKIPLVYIYGIMPFSGFLMLFRTIQVMIEDYLELKKTNKD